MGDTEHLELNKNVSNPKYPKNSNDYTAVQAWRGEMIGYLCEKGLYKTALTGKANRYPVSVITEGDAAVKAMRKQEIDEEYNTRVHGGHPHGLRLECWTVHHRLYRHDLWWARCLEVVQANVHRGFEHRSRAHCRQFIGE